MSTALTINGYGVLELNNVAFRRDGRIEAQCALSATDFANAPAENGMLLCVDKVNNKIVKYASGSKLPVALHYSSEHMYDERKVALKDFALEVGSFYPRMGYLSVGDLFTTNCLCYGSEFTDDAAVKTACAACATTAIYGGVDASGRILLSKTAPTAGPVLKVVKSYTMPDGQFGVKLQVISC